VRLLLDTHALLDILPMVERYRVIAALSAKLPTDNALGFGMRLGRVRVQLASG
jgi:hypothetical protein